MFLIIQDLLGQVSIRLLNDEGQPRYIFRDEEVGGLVSEMVKRIVDEACVRQHDMKPKLNKAVAF